MPLKPPTILCLGFNTVKMGIFTLFFKSIKGLKKKMPGISSRKYSMDSSIYIKITFFLEILN